MSEPLRVIALEQAVALVTAKNIEYPEPHDGQDMLLYDLEQIIFGCADRMLQWLEGRGVPSGTA